MTLVGRTSLTFGWMLLLILVACAYVVHGIDSLADGAAEQRRISEAVEHANFLDVASLRTIVLIEQYIDIPDRAKLAELRSLREQSAERRKALRASTILPRVRELLDSFEVVQPARAQLADSLIEAVESGDGNLVLLRQQREALDRRARGYLREIVDIENGAMSRSVRETDDLGRSLRRNTVVLFAIIIVLTLLASIATVRSISSRLVPILGMATQVSQGQFKVRVPVQGQDEVATLSRTFNKMASDLQELDKAKEEFVALASHQLRTPATAVKANIAMLLDGYFGELSAEQREYLQDAFDANERQLEVIDDILFVARVETGRLSIDKDDTELRGLVEAAVAEHRFGMAARRQKVELVVPATDVHIHADGRKLRMVLDNLLSNASKYTPEGGEVSVRLEALGDGVRIEVADSGVGIAPADQQRLFEKFVRIDNPLSVSSGGSGLGLYLAREIIRLHGGEITVQSALKRGSTFCVQLPRT